MEGNVEFDKVLNSIKILPTVDKLKLIKLLSTQVEFELKKTQSKPRKSLRGLWKGISITDSEISEARGDMNTNFPRSDI